MTAPRIRLSLSIYDGRTMLGGIIEHGKEYKATDARGRMLGTFGSRLAAMKAISATVPQADSSGGGAAPPMSESEKSR
jgi:hypothetical protein